MYPLPVIGHAPRCQAPGRATSRAAALVGVVIGSLWSLRALTEHCENAILELLAQVLRVRPDNMVVVLGIEMQLFLTHSYDT